MSHLVLEIGNYRIKGAFFEDEKIIDVFYLLINEPFIEKLEKELKKHRFSTALIASVNKSIEKQVTGLFEQIGLPYRRFDSKTIKAKLDVDEPEALGQDRIANIYGALYRFPQNDCIVVDLGTAVTVDCISKNGHYMGGVIYPGPAMSAKALATYTDQLPLVRPAKPQNALGKTTEEHIQSGIYWGLLGAIERITAELRIQFDSPSSIKMIATGGGTRVDTSSLFVSNQEFIEDLKELIDLIDPQLTLIGMHEILKELLNQ